MIGSGSNALMTMALDDDYYSVSTFSSIGTVENTVYSSDVLVSLHLYNPDTDHYYWQDKNAILSNGRYRFYAGVPNGYCIIEMAIIMTNHFPTPGTYAVSFDYASDFAYEWLSGQFYVRKDYANAASVHDQINVVYSQHSGDIYMPPVVYDISSVNHSSLSFWIDPSENVKNIGGSFAINFTRVESGTGSEMLGGEISSSDYQSDVSSSLSDLSSSVDSMSEDLSSAAQNLEYISTSQNLIIQGIDNVVMHISDQLFAFWNQLFNLIHVPTMAKMDDIISAINNMDLEIEVNLDGLKSTINNMSTAVQNKLQSTTDKITGGYDNTGITQENEKLEQSINQYDEVESGIFEDAEGFIGDFEYPSVDNLPLGIIKALAFVGSFLQGVFLSMGEFSVIITFSLTMIFVMVVVGYHRIRS